jgi:hypothetical protein
MQRQTDAEQFFGAGPCGLGGYSRWHQIPDVNFFYRRWNDLKRRTFPG